MSVNLSGFETNRPPNLGWVLELWDCLPHIRRADEGMAKTSKKAKRTPNAAFMKPVTPDGMLAKVIGDKPLPRTELTKKLWVYIRKNGLQDAKKRTLINADDNLKAVFNGKKQVSMFEMTKLVSGHVKK
ncbi:MAG TPA: SWIB/MDM2 domain-containing protein [Verrucomicrobiae bacterium]|nr:SWIB/MDM2 domain-containing protein [Verrucomicrobiae bacterium]